ncbi:MAG TPA: isochorismatase family protein [Syntrophorhabdaceae bacterium]
MNSREREKGKGIAALVIDMQGDFTQFAAGSLAVPGTGKNYIDEVEAAARLLKTAGFLVFGSQDWHPPDHVSFFTSHKGKKAGDTVEVDGRRQMLWPPHCVQATEKAAILIDNGLFHEIVKKGADSRFDSYSAFQDEGGNETALESLLRSKKVEKIVIFGVAIDYCVKYTALDGRKRGFSTIVIESLSRGIASDTAAAAIEEMKSAGVVIMKQLDLSQIEKNKVEKGIII